MSLPAGLEPLLLLQQLLPEKVVGVTFSCGLCGCSLPSALDFRWGNLGKQRDDDDAAD